MFIRLFGAYFWIEKKMENNLGTRRKKDTPKNLFVKHVTIRGSTEDWVEKKIHSSDC